MGDIKDLNRPIDILLPEQGDKVYYRDPEGVDYTLREAISDGGQGYIYKGTGGKLFKIYKKESFTEAAIKKLEAMVSKEHNLSDNICWPEALIFEPSEKRLPVGFSMVNVNAKEANIPTLEQLVNNPAYHGEEWNRKNFLLVCINMIDLFIQLHNSGILMGDVNPRNILVDEDCNVFFIDVDSYQFDEYICPVGMPEYVSPRIHKLGGAYSEIKRTEEDERYAIITLIYRTLFLNALPFPIGENVSNSIRNYRFRFGEGYAEGDDQYIWGNLTPALRKAFLDAYTKGEYVDERSLKKLLNELYDWMEQDFVSDDLLPVEAIDESQLNVKRFKTVFCGECGGSYKKIDDQNDAEALCAACRKDRKNNRKIIHRLICSNCQKTFTVNPWDSNGVDPEKCLCPDCDSNAVFPLENYGDRAILKAQYEQILKNLEFEDGEDYI